MTLAPHPLPQGEGSARTTVHHYSRRTRTITPPITTTITPTTTTTPIPTPTIRSARAR